MDKRPEAFTCWMDEVGGMVSAMVFAILDEILRKRSMDAGKLSAVGGFMLNLC